MSFSGGFDSSALLGAATLLARRHGLPDPVPATLVFGGSTAADESEYQRAVIGRLDLDESAWLRFEITDELGLLGPAARELLTTRGLMWPFNTYFHMPIVRAAKGGTVVTGFGGDELGRSSMFLATERAFALHGLRSPRHAVHLAFRAAPSVVHFARELARPKEVLAAMPWLTRQGRYRLHLAISAESSQPFGWGRVLREWLWTRRYVQICVDNFSAMAAPFDVRVVHPFVDARVLSCLGTGRRTGMGYRTEMLAALFGDVMPDELLERTTKATFNDPLWTDETLRFAEAWSGEGLDARFIDPEALRAHWLGGSPSAMSCTLLHAAWLHDQARAT